jgi:hypothetical protein
MRGDPRPALYERPNSAQNHARRAAILALLVAFATVVGFTAIRATAIAQTPVPRTLYVLHGRI